MTEDYPGLVLEEASPDDLNAIALIHQAALAVGVMANCGTAFLERMYASIMCSSASSLVVARVNDEVAGFIVGTTEDVSPFAAVTPGALVIFLFNCLRKPYLVLTSLQLLREIKREQSRPGDMEISHLAVSDRYRDRGIGYRLISVIEQDAGRRGLRSLFTRTHNERLIKFYKSRFAAVEESRVHTSKIDYVTLTWQLDHNRTGTD